MLVATFYPILDGGIQQISQIYQGWKRNKSAGQLIDGTTSPSPENLEPTQVEPKESEK